MSAGKPVCHFILPGLTEALTLLSQFENQRFPALEKALSRASGTVLETSYEHLLANLFELEINPETKDVPIAALFARELVADELLKSHQWLRASPVNLVPDRDRLVLHLPENEYESSVSEMLATFSSELLATFADVFEDVVISQKHGLLLRLAGCAQVLTTPLNEAVGQHVDGLLPAGTDARKWNSILNEIQMLLHQKGAPESGFNALWIEGCGSLPEPVNIRGVISSGDDELLKGFSSWQGGEYCEEFENIENLLSRAEKLLISELSVFRSLLMKSPGNCLRAIAQADLYLSRLLGWLDAGKLSEINLYLLNGKHYCIRKAGLLTFLKRKKKLSELHEKIK
jgi:hypothetical protein